MSQLQRVGDLEIAQDLDYQRHEWVAQRVAWAVLALVILAALAGLLGPGPLSAVSAGAAGDALRLEYHRFLRQDGPTELRVEAEPASGGEARIWVSREWLSAVRVESIAPEPERVETGDDRLLFVFPLEAGARSAEVTFHVKPERAGRLSGRVGLDRGPSFSFDQLVWP